MKKILLVFMLLAMFLTGCSNKNYVNEINVDTLLEKLDNKESFVFYLAMHTCSACQEFKPTMKEFANNNKYDVYVVYLDDESEENIENLIAALPVEYTPTTYVIEDGKYVSEITGAITYNELKEFININTKENFK